MSRFLATTLDLSRLPPPAVVKPVDYEAIRVARMSDFQRRMALAGLPYDVGALETDPAAILEQVDAYREMLDLAAINDAAKAVMLPYAVGPDLDVLGAHFGVSRLAGETDDACRARIQLAPEAYATAGSLGAYIYHARSVDPAIRDVGVTSPSPGVARVVVLGSPDGQATPAALVDRVHARLNAEDVRPLTDQIVTLGAAIAAYAIRLRLTIPAGPDPAIVAASAEASLRQLAADRYRVGAGLKRSAISGAAYSPNVRGIVVLEPAADIAASPLAAPWCVSVTVETEVAVDG